MEHRTNNEITRELAGMGSPLARWPRTVPFALPPDYFAHFQRHIESIIESSKAAEDPQLFLPGSLPFEAPEGYFEQLVQDILPEVNPSFAFIGKKMPFEVPEGYFGQLPEQIMAEASPSFAAAGKEMPFEVPQGYFKQLPDQILTAATAADAPVESRKVISLVAPWKIIRWAAAAMLVLGLGLGSYRFYQGYHTPDKIAEHRLAAVDQDALNDYMDQNVDDYDGEALESSVAANNAIALNNINQIDNQEIIQYLDETGWKDPSTN